MRSVEKFNSQKHSIFGICKRYREIFKNEQTNQTYFYLKATNTFACQFLHKNLIKCFFFGFDEINHYKGHLSRIDCFHWVKVSQSLHSLLQGFSPPCIYRGSIRNLLSEQKIAHSPTLFPSLFSDLSNYLKVASAPVSLILLYPPSLNSLKCSPVQFDFRKLLLLSVMVASKSLISKYGMPEKHY